MYLPQSYELMRLPPRDATAEGDLTIPFQQSALKSTAEQDPFFQHLKIRYVKAADSSEAAQVDLQHPFWLLIASNEIARHLLCTGKALRIHVMSLHSSSLNCLKFEKEFAVSTVCSDYWM